MTNIIKLSDLPGYFTRLNTIRTNIQLSTITPATLTDITKSNDFVALYNAMASTYANDPVPPTSPNIPRQWTIQTAELNPSNVIKSITKSNIEAALLGWESYSRTVTGGTDSKTDAYACSYGTGNSNGNSVGNSITSSGYSKTNSRSSSNSYCGQSDSKSICSHGTTTVNTQNGKEIPTPYSNSCGEYYDSNTSDGYTITNSNGNNQGGCGDYTDSNYDNSNILNSHTTYGQTDSYDTYANNSQTNSRASTLTNTVSCEYAAS